MTFINELKEISKRAHEEKKVKIEDNSAFLAKKDILDRERAKLIVERVERRAIKVAHKGKRTCKVAKLKLYGKPRYIKEGITGSLVKNQQLTSKDLLGTYKYVCERLEHLGFTIDIFWTHDGGGVTDWYEFWVKW